MAGARDGGATKTVCLSKLIFAVLGSISLVIPIASAGFVDMETPVDKRTTTSLIDGTEYFLVSSPPRHNLSDSGVLQMPSDMSLPFD